MFDAAKCITATTVVGEMHSYCQNLVKLDINKVSELVTQRGWQNLAKPLYQCFAIFASTQLFFLSPIQFCHVNFNLAGHYAISLLCIQELLICVFFLINFFSSALELVWCGVIIWIIWLIQFYLAYFTVCYET